MASGGLHLPMRVQLLVDVVLTLLFFSLDTRDLIYKTQWLGPEDSYSFATTSPWLALERKPLEPTTFNASVPETQWSVQSLRTPQRSGWTSFLQRCQSLHALTPQHETRVSSPTFSHVLARNCQVGRRGAKHTVSELVLTSSVRVDSVAWAACKMLFHHRKPPICHSPVVRLFGHRYNMDDKTSLLSVDHTNGTLWLPTEDGAVGPAAYSARPGSSAEMEIIELLTVISRSSPLGSAVCVEGFAPSEGAGYYTSSFFGCGSPTYNHSAFVGLVAKGFKQYHQDKAWLTADRLHISGMTYMIRENRRSIFVVKGSTSDGSFRLEHRTLLNFSSSGVLYTVGMCIDLVLVLVHVSSATEIMKLMLWPLWKSRATANTVVSRSATKMAFAAEDCQAVLTASLYRSKPIVLLIVVADVVHWMTVVPHAIVLSARGVADGARVHAALSTFRFWVLVLLTLHSLWDTVVSWYERAAFAFVRGTYITIAEVATISGLVGLLRRSALLELPALKYAAEGQRLTDTTSFVGRVAFSNAFPEHLDSLQNTSAAVVSLLYMPLITTIAWSLVAIACVVGGRFLYFQLRYPDAHKHHHNARFFVQPRASAKSTVQPDLDPNGSPRNGPSPPPSPVAHRPAGSPTRTAMEAPTVLPASGNEHALRLPLENVVDVPIRARSLVRNSWKMEKKIGHQIFLRPPQYLEHGIILQGGCLTTRLGFMDIVHPYLRAGNHVMPDDETAHRTSTSGSSSPRRLSSGDKLRRDAHTLRMPLVPLR